MAYIKKLVNGKKRKVYVIDTKCKDRKCLVISDCNNPGHYYCRINEISGCPENKD
jgi:hypothetical protein